MRYDPVTLDIIWNRLISICDEAETGVMRTAFSHIVRESRDFCCLLLDSNGDSIAQGSLSLIVFLSSAPLTVKKMLEKFPADTLEPGDIVITNNPWVNAGHLNDVCALEPVYHRGKLIALAACVMHWADVGGCASLGDSRSVYEEGLQLPIIKIAKRGEFNEEVMEIIRENIRFPNNAMADFRSQLIGNDLMRSKLIELIEMQGIEDFPALGETILTRCETAMRSAIGKIPDGDYDNEVPIEGMDGELTLRAKVSVRGTDIHVDYTGSSPQSNWSINSMPHYAHAYTFIAIKAAVAPHLPNNSGQMRPVSITMPVGSIVNPRPRSVGAGARHLVGLSCCPAVFGALSKAIPQQSQAESHPFAAVHYLGVSEDGKPFVALPGRSSGMGARHNGDGISAILWPTSSRNTPTEMTEYYAPDLLVERQEIRVDSGGAGKYRGGCGLQTDVRLIGPASAVARPALSGILYPARGLLGGHSGVTASVTLNGAPIPALLTAPIKCGDRVNLRTLGGGGFGDPFDRDPALVLADVIAGLVSPEQAEASYGVVMDPARKSIDLEATRQRRALR